MSAEYSTMTVELGERSYDIVVGEGLLADAGRLIQPLLAEPKVVIITDDNVKKHWLGTLETSLDDVGISHESIALEAGEQTKDYAHAEDLIGKLLDAGIDRATTLLALGGGVIGDIAGFAAAITLRGLDLVQIPTTLLAQVDSSVGGKTGINTPQGKNLIGAFHQPRLVLADISTLGSLQPRDLRAGYAEVVKYGLIGDADFFAWLEANGKAVIEAEADACRHAVLTSCQAKAAIVADDEREKGSRALLNLGHTFGHALEAQSGYGENLVHGEAVAIGIGLAFDLSVRMGLCPAEDRDRVQGHFKAMGLPVGLEGLADETWSAAKLVEWMGKDKKVRAGSLTFVLVRGIGKAFISRDVEPEDLSAVLEEHLAPGTD